MICRKYCFQKVTQFSQENQVLDAPASNTVGCLWRDTCGSSTQLNRSFLKQRDPITTLKNPCCRKYSCQKLPQLSQGNNVLDAAASIIDGFLWRDTCVSSTQLSRPFWNKRSFLHLGNCDLQEVFLSKTT
jgi:hypothetical protein